ncbi:hypothetical protein, partial [Salmonella enterica]|uniref:hypothetical protein n=1 Tax=Salmonella enterica TaxID=28901 RepID=UPI001C0A91CB
FSPPRRKGCGAESPTPFPRPAPRRGGGSRLIPASGPVPRLSPCRRGLIQPQPAALAVQGEMNSPQNFLP